MSDPTDDARTPEGQPGGIPDLEKLLRQVFGPEAKLPPEVTQMLAALHADPA